ncbi:ABC transporter family substrate-binding protein [Actinophytocola xanthii]|uniref:Peptide ABC transporter substrate-binding protein n=1 Tax=Actinophytocola xanthii TaxID=1912961 RepID=A0A1Q8CMU0_9PSEU|nr:ABC transporter family substrate-binding protein [Actinophytocola xanthii]OLF15673.1 peptide ABC transporter substrate-binding protein [Actinophytocola xanthii]
MARRTIAVLALTVVLAAAACTPAPRLVETPVTSPVTDQVDTREVVVGVSSVAGGYNPHQITDQSAITTALANLVLPSVFRSGPDGIPRLDRTVMSSATVTSYDPYTVTYRIRSDASWSDTAPVAAEDFVYLWQQVTDSPGAIDAAGYRLISDINARDAGKVVEVVFAQPYPGWRSLFTNLLPAHLLKDAPGGWDGALQTNFPATAGPYAVKALDTDRGEIVLERSDRYWEEPPVLDRIVLRRADQSGIVDALDAGHDQLALARMDAVGVDLVGELSPAVPTRTVPRPSVSTLVIRPDRPQLTELLVRQAIVALLDRDQLVTAGTGTGPAAALRADAQVLAPSLPGYRSTVPTAAGTATPARHDPALAEQLLTQAGYTRASSGWVRDGQPLDIVVGAAEEREPARRIAEDVRRQLVAAGIATEVLTLPADELYGQLSDTGGNTGDANTLDLAVISQPVGGDQATTLATNFGCAASGEDGQRSAANPLGFCDPAIQPTMDAALSGALSVTDALAAVEPILWRAAVSVPLFQEAETLAVRPEVSNVSLGPPLVGPFAGATAWRRAAG